jgi:molybdopterin converting factor small subunit
MEIQVRYRGVLGDLAGTRQESLALEQGAGLRDLLALLCARHGAEFTQWVLAADGSPRDSLRVFVDEEPMLDGGHDRPLAQGDRVHLFPPVSGGCLGAVTDEGESS